MNRTGFFVAAAVLVSGVAAVAAFLSLRLAPRPLLRNGGFESGAEAWRLDGARVVKDAATAHAGRGFVRGDAPWSLTQRDLPVRTGITYRVAAWARADGDTTLTLWADERIRNETRRLAVWESVPAAWTRFEAFVTAAHNEKLALTFKAAASRPGAAASACIDDVEITEATLPRETQVEPGKGFDDEPTIARAADGTVYVAWLSFRDGAETLQAARLRPAAGGSFERLGSWQVQGPTDAIFVAQASFDERVVLGFVTERADAWSAVRVVLTEDGPRDRREEALSSHTSLQDLRSSCRPSRGDARVLHGCIDGNWEVLLDAARGDRGAPLRLTHAPTIDRNPSLLRRGDQLWIVYENVETRKYGVNYAVAKRLVAARIESDGRLLAPRRYMETSPLWGGNCEKASAAFDEKGRLWIAYRKPRPPTAGWDVYLTGWTGERWTPPIPVSSRKGMCSAPGVAIDGNRAIVAFQAGDVPEGWSDIERMARATSGVWLASIDLPDVAAAPQDLAPLVENAVSWQAGEIRRRFGDDRPAATTTNVGGEKLALLYGDLHSHSDASVCQRLLNGTPAEVYEMQRDFERLDFACMTDHGECLNAYLWRRQAKYARLYDTPGTFTTFLGEEWTSGYDPRRPQGFYGHRNVILADTRFPRWFTPQAQSTPADLWAALRAAGANFVTIPHQLADVGNVPTDWSFTDDAAQPVAEVFQVRGSYEARDAPRAAACVTSDTSRFLQGAWRNGVVCGVIASPDHGGGVGKACVWAKDRSREAILDALRARRCYGTTGARIALEVRVGGHFMGERTAEVANGPVEIAVRATCPGDVAKVSICRDGAWIHAEKPADRAFDLRFVDVDAPGGPKWYYVRIEQADGEIAWSSPVWLGASAR